MSYPFTAAETWCARSVTASQQRGSWSHGLNETNCAWFEPNSGAVFMHACWQSVLLDTGV